MAKTERGPSRALIYQVGEGRDPGMQPPVLVVAAGGAVTWENLTTRVVEIYFPGGDRYLTDPGPISLGARQVSQPKRVKRTVPRHAFSYRAVQIGQEEEPDREVHGNSDPIIIIR